MNLVNIIANISSPKGIFLLLHVNDNGIDEFYVALNYYTFVNWTAEQRNMVRIVQLVSKSIFFPDNQTLIVNDMKFTDDNYKDIFYKQIYNNDANFNNLISDIEKSNKPENAVLFSNVSKFLNYDSISSTDKIVVCEYFDNTKKTYIEINGNQYFEIPDTIFALIKRGKIDTYFEEL